MNVRPLPSENAFTEAKSRQFQNRFLRTMTQQKASKRLATAAFVDQAKRVVPH